MNQRDVDRAVAKATGETVRTVSERGFLLLDEEPQKRSPDWDELQAERNVRLFAQRRQAPVVV